MVCPLFLLLGACAEDWARPADDAVSHADWMFASRDGLPSVSADSAVEAGRYLTVVAMCNECHTDGWRAQGLLPEDEWLTGSEVGLEGPWGVTFASNLRLLAADWTEDEWLETLRTRKRRQPMPWLAVNVMSEKDARAIYRFLDYLGPAGRPAPEAIDPEQAIDQPYISLRELPPHTVNQ